jgi:hypothetical protein
VQSYLNASQVTPQSCDAFDVAHVAARRAFASHPVIANIELRVLPALAAGVAQVHCHNEPITAAALV